MVSAWMVESDMDRQRAQRVEQGMEAPDYSQYSEWRQKVRHDDAELMDFYGIYLVGQYQGGGMALSLDAVREALDLEGMPRQGRQAIVQRVLQIHACFVELIEERRKAEHG